MTAPTPASLLAAMAEKATPEVLEITIQRFRDCAFVGENKDGLPERCGRARLAHPQRDHAAWMPEFDPVESIRFVELLMSLSRHEGQADRALGLDKHEAQVVVMGWGITAEQAKKMSQDERDRYLLKRMGEVIDAEVVESEAAPQDSAPKAADASDSAAS